MRNARYAGWIRVLVAGALMVAPALAQGEGTAESLVEIERQVAGWRSTFNRSRAEYDRVAERARQVRVKLPHSRDPRLHTPRTPSAFDELDVEEMLGYLPQALLDDVNRRIYREYDRGYHEWRSGYFPPMRYVGFDADTQRWTYSLFVDWDRDGSLFWSVPRWVHSLYVDAEGTRIVAGDFDSELAELPALQERSVTAIGAAEGYRADARGKKLFGFIPWFGAVWENEGEWNRIEGEANAALAEYADTLGNVRNLADGQARRLVSQAVQYRGGDRPTLGFQVRWRADRRSGTGDGYSYRRADRHGSWAPTWEYWFDEQVLEALPERYRREVERRFVHAYFRGAYDAKYDQSFQRGTGSGYDYDFGRSGTGDGYSYGGDRWRGTGSGRTPRAWDQGTGSGTDDSWTGGTGSGSGTGSGTGTGSGNDDPADDPWGEFGGGTGSGSSSGTGSGGTGTGSGTGSGSSGGTGSGTGTGSGSSGTGSG